jgi:hypothetical protein
MIERTGEPGSGMVVWDIASHSVIKKVCAARIAFGSV